MSLGLSDRVFEEQTVEFDWASFVSGWKFEASPGDDDLLERPDSRKTRHIAGPP